MAHVFGKTMLIANPAARSGRGAHRIEEARNALASALSEESFEVRLTGHSGHAAEIAAATEGFKTVLALGGDGLVSEVANGLMAHGPATRPTLGVIPAGSGNDYAKTLGMSTDVDRACQQLLDGVARPVDIGRVNDRWFVETLSFGLDAAIALETMDRRTRTKRRGALLYLESGIDQLLHHLRAWRYIASFDGHPAEEGESITFAVQLGPYYGGGFKICPDAQLDDGELSLCIAHPPVSVPRAAFLFVRAKSGQHTGFEQMELLNACTVHVEFEEAPPAQVDGEPLEGRKFDISITPNALNVIRP